MAIASFAASAYALYFLPLPPVKVGIINTSELRDGGEKKGAGGYGFNTPAAPTPSTHARPSVPYVSDEVADALAKYIVPTNAGLCAILAFFEMWRGRSWSGSMGIGGGYLPGVVFGVVMWARRELRVMDMSELEKLKSGMKDT